MSIRVLLLIVLIDMVAPNVLADSEATAALRATIGKWVDTLQVIDKEQKNWDIERQVMTSTREALIAEMKTLKEQIEVANKERESADKDSTDISDKKIRLENIQTSLSKTLGIFEEKFIGLVRFFPSALTGDLGAELEVLKKEAKARESLGVASRLQTLIAILSKAEKFQSGITVIPEVHKVAFGQELQLDTLYMGLSSAYAVNKDGNVALRGYPTAEGWKFEDFSKHASSVQRIINMSRGEGHINFVPLEARLK